MRSNSDDQQRTTDRGPRTNLWRWVGIAAAVGSWSFLLLSLGSFRPTDWPSHAIYPYPPIANLCGPAGAFLAYYLFLAFGQGAFAILLFTGLGVVFFIVHDRVNDLWMRSVGLLLLTVAFAAVVHHLWPGSENGFPEGQGGVLGIGAAHYLQSALQHGGHEIDPRHVAVGRAAADGG